MRKSELINRKAFSLRTFKPQSNSEREALRKKLAQDVEEYLSRNKKIIQIESFKSGLEKCEESDSKNRLIKAFDADIDIYLGNTNKNIVGNE